MSIQRLLHSVEVALRWSDLDALNHVNNARFLTYIEEARLAWFASLPEPWSDERMSPLLAAVEINFRQPIHWPAALRVELSAQRIGSSSLTIGHRMVDAEAPERCYADGHSVIVWIDLSSGRPIPLPAFVRACAASSLDA